MVANGALSASTLLENEIGDMTSALRLDRQRGTARGTHVLMEGD